MTEHDLQLLTGESAAGLLAAALATAGGRPQSWRVSHVDHQPGGDTTVGITARVEWPHGAASREIIGAVAGGIPHGTARLTDGSTEVGVWRFPHDPDLPALPDACDPDRIAALLGVRPLRLRLRAYRPRRRAVIEATTARGSVFIKVLRPQQAEPLYRRHRIALAAGCPVPGPLACSPGGLLALAGLPGRTLRSELCAGSPGLSDVDGVLALLDALPPELATDDTETWGRRAPHYAEVIAATVPAMAERARAIAAAVHHDGPQSPRVAVHGDFYESQLMVDGGSAVGVLDIDTLGGGERADDLGCLLGHLSVLAQLRPQQATVINPLGQRLQQHFAARCDPALLARRAAAVVLSLATGPHRVQEPGWAAGTERRIALAERWLDEGAFIASTPSAS